MDILTNRRRLAALWCVRAVALVALASLAPIALSQPPVPAQTAAALASRFPAAAIVSVEIAEKALAEATAERASIETQFAIDERACYSKFFATSCLEKAKDRRRRALRLVSQVEVDANRFKRRQRVVDRDRELEQGRASDRSKVPPPANSTQESASVSADPTGQKAVAPAADDGKRRNSHSAHTPRAPRVVQPKARKIEQASDPQKRAENVAAYQRKVAESEARQRDVAEKKAEKERERAAKDKAASKP